MKYVTTHWFKMYFSAIPYRLNAICMCACFWIFWSVWRVWIAQCMMSLSIKNKLILKLSKKESALNDMLLLHFEQRHLHLSPSCLSLSIIGWLFRHVGHVLSEYINFFSFRNLITARISVDSLALIIFIFKFFNTIRLKNYFWNDII